MATAKISEASAAGAADYSPIVVFIGVGTCVASIIGLFLFPAPELGMYESLAAKALIAAFMAITFLVMYRMPARFSSLRGELVSCSLSAVGLMSYVAAYFLPGMPYAVYAVLGCAAAIGIAALITVWFVDLCLRPRTLPMSHVAGAFAIALVIVCCEVLFDGSIRPLAIAVGWAVSSVLSFTQWRHHCTMEIPPAAFDIPTVDARSRIMPESYVMMGVICVQTGFLIGIVCAESTIVSVAPFVIVAALAAAVILAIDSASRKSRITERSLFPITIPFTVAGYACVYLFGDGVVHIVALCVLAVFAAIYIITGTVALSTHVILEQLSPVRSYAKSRMINYIGFALGIALGFIVAWAHEASVVSGIQATVLVAVAYTFIASFFHRPRFPDSTLKSGSADVSKGHWSKRCFEVSERHSLSSRQYEVLCLIAQGRNAEYVAKTLTISVSTVQTHIRNIYQKLNVHSRQELIDLIEETKLYGED